MKCEKCGWNIDSVMVDMFNYDGSDGDVRHYFTEAEHDAVVIETDRNWAGYELSEDEMLDSITCPHCHQFPFISTEIQIYDVVRIVCFKQEEAQIADVGKKELSETEKWSLMS